jgi:hypothetical protein
MNIAAQVGIEGRMDGLRWREREREREREMDVRRHTW